MNYAELLAIALALAVDAGSYAFSYGLMLRRGRMSAALALALVAGVFQAGMPLLGYVSGVGLRSAVESYGHWIGCAIFTALGLHVLYQAYFDKRDDSEHEQSADSRRLGLAGLLLVGLATSIDAFAVGICLAIGRVLGGDLAPRQLAVVAAVIGVVAFIIALVGFWLSAFLRHLPERLLQTLAGLLLLALGLHQVM